VPVTSRSEWYGFGVRSVLPCWTKPDPFQANVSHCREMYRYLATCGSAHRHAIGKSAISTWIAPSEPARTPQMAAALPTCSTTGPMVRIPPPGSGARARTRDTISKLLLQ
jgi:hypothetical protein